MHARARILFFATTTRMSPAFYDSPTQATKAARDDTVTCVLLTLRLSTTWASGRVQSLTHSMHAKWVHRMHMRAFYDGLANAIESGQSCAWAEGRSIPVYAGIPVAK